MPLGLSNSRPIKLEMSVAFSGSADVCVLTPMKNAMHTGCSAHEPRQQMEHARRCTPAVQIKTITSAHSWSRRSNTHCQYQICMHGRLWPQEVPNSTNVGEEPHRTRFDVAHLLDLGDAEDAEG